MCAARARNWPASTRRRSSGTAWRRERRGRWASQSRGSSSAPFGKAAEIRPLAENAPQTRTFGLDRGKVVIPPEFFEPLGQDTLALFTGRALEWKLLLGLEQYHVGRQLNMLFARVSLVFATLPLSAAPAAGECAVRPLAVTPSAIGIHAATILEGLVELGQANSVCFGVEVGDDRLAKTEVSWTTPAPVAKLLASALSGTRPYAARGIGKIVRISPLKTVEGGWLATKIPRFQCPRTISVQWASLLLYMALRTQEDPSLAMGGFAGDFRPGDNQDQIGPFDERNKTVREILDFIVSSSKGGLWLAVEQRAENLSSQPWIILEYSEPLSVNLGQIRGAETRIRSRFASRAE